MEEKKIKVKGSHTKTMNICPFRKKTLHKKFTAPTVGLEQKIFDFGTPKKASKLTEFRDNIAKHVVVYFKYTGPEADPPPNKWRLQYTKNQKTLSSIHTISNNIIGSLNTTPNKKYQIHGSRTTESY